MRRRTTVLAAAVLGVVLLPALAFAASSRIVSPEQAAADAAPPEPSVLTAAVERKVLAQEVVVRGTVDAPVVAVNTVVPADAMGTAVTQWLVQPGDEVAEGAVIVTLGDRPVFVLEGPGPAFRTMGPGVTGSDVLQLQDALRRLGFDLGADPPGTYGRGTERAVAAMYSRAGFPPVTVPEGGVLRVAETSSALQRAERVYEAALAALARELTPAADEVEDARAALAAAEREAQVVAELGALRSAAADRSVAQAEAALRAVPETAPVEEVEAARRAVEQASMERSMLQIEQRRAAAEAEAQVGRAARALARVLAPPAAPDLQRAVEDARDGVLEAQRAVYLTRTVTGVGVPWGEVVFVPNLPAIVVATAERSGVAGQAQNTLEQTASIMELISGRASVSAVVTPSQRAVLATGMTARIDVEATGQRYEGVVTALETRNQGGGQGPAFALTVAPRTALPLELRGANVRVTVTAAATPAAVLAVPVAAVSSTVDGRLRVTVDDDDGQREVTITTGVSAGGFVEVTAAAGDLREGDLVVVGVPALGSVRPGP